MIPELLAESSRQTRERSEWLNRLPDTIHELEERWSIRAGEPFDTPEVTCAWVAPAQRANGEGVVLKLSMPHDEGRDEIGGLRAWEGDPTVRLLAADERAGAMLLERCVPGTSLRALPEAEQDPVIAGLLRRIWRAPAEGHSFRPLSELMAHWTAETTRSAERWADASLVREGLRLFVELPESAPWNTLLATDLHAGNVLRAEREPWLVIDPKPFVGDPAYDATQHLFNCVERLRADPGALILRFADLLHVEAERVRLWAFARAAAEPREDWRHGLALARRLAVDS